MKEHTHLHPYLGTSVPALGYYYYDTLFQDLYIKRKKYFVMEIHTDTCYNRTEGGLDW